MKKKEIHYIKKSSLGDISYLRDLSGRIVDVINNKKAKCHPTEKHYCKGLCRVCYEKQLRKSNPQFAKRQRENRRNWEKTSPQKAKKSRETCKERRKSDPILKARDKQNKRKKLLESYGLSERGFNELLKNQNYKCGVCKKQIDIHTANIDHDHKTNKVRGLLCKACNFLVGTFENRIALLMQAGRYLYSSGGGTKYDTDKLLFGALPTKPLQELVRVFNIGANKYGMDNWRDGILWSKIFSAMQRHAWKWWGGEEFDKEDGQHHLASIAWCALVLLEYINIHSELDDRVERENRSSGNSENV